jgi:hypothetical protein
MSEEEIHAIIEAYLEPLKEALDRMQDQLSAVEKRLGWNDREKANARVRARQALRAGRYVDDGR